MNIECNFHSIKIELQKVLNLLGATSDHKDLPRFVTKKWIEIYDQSQKYYSVIKKIRIKTPMLRADLCDYSDAYIIVKGDITAFKKEYTEADFPDTLFPDDLFTDNLFPDDLFPDADFPDVAAKAAGRNAARIVVRRAAKTSAVNAANAVNANDTYKRCGL